jgi:Uma2 family endonuclease
MEQEYQVVAVVERVRQIAPREAPTAPPPPLENGDRLSREEFERRYEAMPQVKRAELVEGVVFMGSPVRIVHGEPHASVVTWLGTYRSTTPSVRFADNTTLRLDPDNEFQPDALLFIEERAGGRSRVTEEDYLEGAPELVVEVAASSASIDRHTKFDVYRRIGVREYILWQVLDKRLEWFELRDGLYYAIAADENGIVQSRVFPGLRLHVSALLADDLATVLAEQQRALSSAEHKRFVEALTARLTS